MVKINLFNQADYDLLLLKREVEKFNAERVQKSFSGRHPELGKMIKCAVCGNRHRSSRVCVPDIHVALGYENDEGQIIPATKRQRDGAAAFKGRILKHRNKWGLQVLERATLIYRERRADPYKTEISDDDLGKACLSRALNEKRVERAADRAARLRRMKRSRRINRGL